MRGYSFSELVKLAEAAMPRAGGTFGGAITAPQMYISNTQSSEPRAATRFDWVNARLQERLPLTGGYLSGKLEGRTTLAPNRLKQLNGAGAAFNVSLLEVKPGSQGGVAYAEALHASTRVPEGYIQHISFGTKRLPGEAWHSMYLATGESESGATVEWLFDASSVLSCPGPVHLGGATQDTAGNSAARVDWVKGQVGQYLPLSGGTLNGRLTIAADGSTLMIRPKTAAEASYLLGQDYIGNPQWYVGKGDTGANVMLYNYVGGAGINLQANGSILLSPTNSVVSMKNNLHLAGSGNKEIRMLGANGEDHFIVWYQPSSNATYLRTGGGGHCTLSSDGSFQSPASLKGNLLAVNSDNVSLQDPGAGALGNWRNRAPALRVLMPDANSSGSSIWKATLPGAADLAAMDIHRAAAGVRLDLHFEGGASQHVWDGSGYTSIGNIHGRTGVLDSGHRVYSPVNVPVLPATHGYNDVINGGTFNIGAYMFLQNHPDLQVGVIAPGATCDGSRLFPTSVDNEWDDIYPSAVPGIWRCQGYSTLGAGSDSDWTAGKTLWIRVA